MAIAPTLISGSAFIRTDQLLRNQAQLDDLNRQLATGEVATTYGELGSQRFQSVSLRADISRLDAYQSTIQRLDIRLDITGLSLERLDEIRVEGRDAIDANNFVELGNGQTFTQQRANLLLTETFAILNGQADDRYIFGGNDVLEPPLENLEIVLEGDATRDGLRAVTEERLRADLGVNDLGRLTINQTGNAVALTEEAITDFGFDLAGANNDLSNVNATFTAGEPATLNVDFTGQPEPGESLTVFFNLPDGTQISTEFEVDGSSNARTSFELGADATETAANFQQALQDEIQFLARTELNAASRIQAAESFFNTENGVLPQRVDTSLGPPETATGLISATPDNTVIYYTGQNDGTDPRQSLTARLDEAITVGYGLRANEEAFRSGIISLAAFAIGDFTSGTDGENASLHTALATRTSNDLGAQVGASSIQAVTQEIGGLTAISGNASERNDAVLNTLNGIREEIERADQTEVAVQLLALQNQIEASFAASGRLSSLTLLNFLP